MKLVEFVPPTPHPLWELCPQMGITDVIVKVNPDLTGLPDPWRYDTLASIVGRLKAAGLTVVGLEGDPFDMSPIKEFGSYKEHKDHKEELFTNDNCHNCSQITNGKVAVATGSFGVSEKVAEFPNLQNSKTPSGGSNINPVNPFNPVKKNQDALREEALAHYRELLESMGRLGIKLLCYNFMVGKGWSRTGVREGRGGAKATYFSLKETEKERTSDIGHQTSSVEVRCLKSEVLKLTAEQVWANYEYFIKAVMPTAEKWGIRMGLHPDDPCLPSLGGYARIFGSVEAYDRAYALYPSPSNAVTFCQANFKLMFTNDNCHKCSQITNRKVAVAAGSFGVSEKVAEFPNLPNSKTPSSESNINPVNPVNPVENLESAARHFGNRIAFIHVRDVEGTCEDFTELFHDQGDVDQFALMRVYREIGLDVPVRGDHVPEMAYDRVLTPEGTPGYFTLGRLFANGYLKALLQGTVAENNPILL